MESICEYWTTLKLVRDGLGWLGSNQPENTVPFVTWNTRNFIPEFLVEWKAPQVQSVDELLLLYHSCIPLFHLFHLVLST